MSLKSVRSAVVTACLWALIPLSEAAPSAAQPIQLMGGASVLTLNAGEFDGTNLETLDGWLLSSYGSRLSHQAGGGAELRESFMNDEYGQTYRVHAEVERAVSGAIHDSSTGQLLSFQLLGSETYRAPRLGGTWTGGYVTLDGLKIDVVGNTVVADLTGARDAVGTVPSISYSLPNAVLWSFDQITGPTYFPVGDVGSAAAIPAMQNAGFLYLGMTGEGAALFSATHVISHLRLTEEGFNFFRHGLGALSTGIHFLEGARIYDGLGDMTVTSYFAVAVPEPEAWTLTMVGGLLALAAARRRRAATYSAAFSRSDVPAFE